MSDSPTTVTEELPASGAVDVPAAEPSPAEPAGKGVENKSMVDVVKAALAGPDKSPTSENGQETKPAPTEDPDSPEAKAKAEDEWLKSISKDGQKRFRELANAKRELSSQLEPLKQKAEEFDRLNGMAEQNQMSPDDVKSAFEISGLIKTNPEEALKRLHPIVKGLLKLTGHELPEDLKAEVEAGALTQARAQELAKQRSTNERLQQTQEQREEQERVRQFTETTDRMARDVDSWASEQKTSDPDWHLKLGRVTEKFKLALHDLTQQKKFPTSEKEVRAMLVKAKGEVEAELKQFVPAPKPSTSHTGRISSAAKPAPGSILDIVKASGNAQ